MTHPTWCDRGRCSADRTGLHVGGRMAVDGPDGRPIATAWVEGSDGDRAVQLSVVRDHGWSADELGLLAAVLATVQAQL